jgi:hypothetical protein
MLGLERLIVGRECNGFDRLTTRRKSLAFAELIRLGHAHGKIEDVAGQDFPNVSVQRVSSRGRRLNRSSRLLRSSRPSTWQPFWLYVALAAALFGCLFLLFKVSGS